ncbi:DUF202 domain-containing protein [Clostridium sp.]|uniref:DUF202 domain-containing protein n=1 Tax=Clostridium sp. TaxID=1506 RepID=UPI002FCA38C6
MKYDKYRENKEDMNLRDHLAVDRTVLASERTYLSYMRTVISFIVAALTLYKLLGGAVGLIVAIILSVSAIYFGIRGRRIYKEVNKDLEFENII